MDFKINSSIKWMLGIFFVSLAAYAANEAGFTGEFLRIRSTTLPATCEDGEIRYNSTSAAHQTCSSNTWSTLGGADELGNIKYYGDYEAGTIGNVSTYDDGSSATPTDLTGGSPATLSTASETSVHLSGTASYKLSKSAADGQGEGFTVTSETIYRAEATGNQPVTISFFYETSANYASADVSMWVYDVGASDLDSLAGRSTLNQEVNNDLPACPDGCSFTATFTPTSSTTTLRLGWHVATTSASAYDIYVDRIRIEPNVSVVASTITDWDTSNTVDFDGSTTAPVKGTTSTDVFAYRRVGDVLQGRIEYVQTAAGTDGSGNVLINMPDGLKIDTTKTGTGVSTNVGMGYVAEQSDALTSRIPVAYLYVNDEDSLGIVIHSVSSDNVKGTRLQGQHSNTILQFNQTNLMYRLSIDNLPIQGWDSGNTVDAVVEDYKNLYVYAGGGSGTMTASTTDINFTEITDTHNAWDGEGLTAPYDMNVLIQGSLLGTGGFTPIIYAYIDGSIEKGCGIDVSHTMHPFGCVVELLKGEELTIRSSATFSISNDATRHHIALFGIPSLRVFAAVGDWVSRDYSSAKNYRVETAQLDCQSSSAIDSEAGSWLTSVGNISAGACAVTIDTGIFSAEPDCFAIYHASPGNAGVILRLEETSATNVDVDCENDAGAECANYTFNLLCRGPR